jgi:hypothetical protein
MARIGLKHLCVVSFATLCSFAAQAEDWWSIPFGANSGGVSALYVEKAGIIDSALGKSTWIVETFAPDRSSVAIKKEHVDIDCTRPRYRGIEWYWTGRQGRVTTNNDEDVRWNTVYLDSPMQTARTFICSGVIDGAVSVQSAPGS